MKKQTFWNEVSRDGATLGAVEVVFLLVSTLLARHQGGGMVLSLLHLAVFITLLTLFTKRQAASCGAEGFSYGKGLKYIFFVSLFAGILCGAYEIVARNWFFPELYRETVKSALTGMAQSNLFSGSQLAAMKDSMETMFFSPFWVVFTDVLGMVIRGLFFGLFVAAFTRREPDIFGE